ncbi:pyrroline-5-carboxylate reductase [Gracilibacillus halophilus]|uniref:pyrroline-5-carboxylate reductase n=1 Tax=Gracilibacillus halophilus TaxID=470864 RepID=UPI003B82F605
MVDQTITFLGAGSMAEAIIAGLTSKQIVAANQVIATNQSNLDRLHTLENHYYIRTTQNKEEALRESDIVILAMKPKDVTVALDDVKGELREDQIIISILAGISTTYIERQLPKQNPVIRVMPNTSATIGQSATTIAAGTSASSGQLAVVESLMQAIGTTTVINEADMDAYTAIAGSGPAFYYYMVEAIEQFVEDKGLSIEQAKPLMIQTLQGVAEMLKTSEDSPKILREKITSPGGTTEAGLNTLSSHDFQKIVKECMQQAAERSAELRKMLEEQ